MDNDWILCKERLPAPSYEKTHTVRTKSGRVARGAFIGDDDYKFWIVKPIVGIGYYAPVPDDLVVAWKPDDEVSI